MFTLYYEVINGENNTYGSVKVARQPKGFSLKDAIDKSQNKEATLLKTMECLIY